MDLKQITFLSAIAIGIVCFGLGFQLGSDRISLQFEAYKLEQAQAVLEAQRKEKEKYDEAIKALDADLSAARDIASERLRQLNAYRDRTNGTQACHSDDALRLAVEGESLLREADGYLRALIK